MSRRVTNHPFPGDDRVQEALLVLLLEKGGKHGALRARDTYAPLADFFHLDQKARSLSRAEYLNDGRNEAYWHTWVQWARDRLVANLDILCPSRGIWMLTDKGKRRAERIKAMLGTGALSPFEVHTPKPISPILLKQRSNITLDELGI